MQSTTSSNYCDTSLDKLLSPEAISKIFSNVESIRNLHEEIYQDLEEKISDIRLVSSIEHCISDIFS